MHLGCNDVGRSGTYDDGARDGRGGTSGTIDGGTAQSVNERMDDVIDAGAPMSVDERVEGRLEGCAIGAVHAMTAHPRACEVQSAGGSVQGAGCRVQCSVQSAGRSAECRSSAG